MPSLNLITNVPGSKVSASRVTANLSKAVASAVGKPEAYVMVSLTTDKHMRFAGSEEPCAYAELVSIGGLGNDKNKTISAALAAVVEEDLSVPSSRFYINFCDVGRTDFGWKGSTF